MKNKKTSSSQNKRAALERRRKQAVKLWKRGGKTQRQIAKQIKVSPEAVSNWVEAYEKEGLKGLKSKGKPGPKSELTNDDKKKIKAAIKKGALKHGYNTDLWTLSRLRKLIKEISGLDYHAGHVWKIMISLGFSCQKPEIKAKERNEKAIKNWKLKTFPKLKKMGAKT